MKQLLPFLHDLRSEIAALVSNPDILLRFQVEPSTPSDSLTLEVVSIGSSIIPFVFDAADLEDLPASRAFILAEIQRRVTAGSLMNNE